MSTRVPTPDSQPEDLLTSGEVGELLNVSSETIRRWAESGKIAVAKTVNGRRYFDRATVESFGDEQPLTISEAAKELGVSVSTLRRYEKKGILVPERSESGQRAYDRAKIKNFDKTSAVKATRTQVATPIVVAEPLGAAPAPVVEPSEEPLPTRAKEKDPVRALGERFSLVSLGGVVVLFVLTFAMVRSLIAIPTDEELQHERQRLAQRYANNGGDGGSTAGFSSNPTGEANDSDATASVAAGDEEDEQSEARVAGLQIETNTLDGLYDAEPGIQRDITVNDGALSIDVYAKAKELLVDLREDHTRFQVQDHETPVFTIDSNKKITTHAGSTLDLNGALQLQGEGPEKDNQFIVASPGVAPQWETFGSLAAKGGLDCEDCLTEQHIPDIYLKNTTDTFSGQLTLSTPEDTPVLILQDTTNNDTAQVYTGTGSPDGVLSAPAGSLFLDQSGATYVNTNNATSWTDLSSGGGGSSKWTDSGTITYLTATTDDVAVGGSTLAASIFSIDQSAGTFLFGGDQSANPTLTFEATDSDTGDFGFNTSDAFFFSGANVGIGDTSPAALFTVGSSDAFQVDNSGNITTAGDLAVNGDDITADGDLTLNPAGGNVIIADADVLDVYGVTIGLNNDADADNLLGLSAAAGEASSDLYWGDDLLCDISETNCGGGSSLFTDGGAITYLTSATDDLALGGSASTSPFFFDESEEQLNINNSTTNAGVLLNQDGNGAALSIDSESTSANVIDLATNTPTTTTGNIIDIQANALTSGSLLDLVSNSSNTSTRSLVNILNDNTSATGATVLTLEQDAAERVAFFNQDADGIALEIDTEATTANVIDISNPQTTTGNVLNLNNVSSLTTGSIGYFRSGGADTSTRSLVYIVNDNPSATGATALEVDQDAAQRGLFLNQDGDGNALEIDSQATSADVINIATPATTTGDVIDIDADALTTGSIINADSNSSDTSTRYLVNIINDNTAATGAVGLRIQQDSTGDIIELYDGASEVFTVDDQGALIIAPASAVTTAIDVSDSDITNALSIGTNTITGTSGVIDFTAFDVAGTGAVTIAPTSSLTTAIDLTDSDITNAISLGQNTILGTTGVIDFNQFDVSGTGVVINEGASTAVDVRIEGASETHLFFVDASTDRVGIGISSPEQTLHVRGPDSAGSIGAYIDNSQAHGLLVEAGNSSSEYILRLQDGSAAHVLEVRHTGELGLGTSSPGDLLHIADDNSATNSVVDLFRIELTSTGTPAAGLGSGVVFHIEDAGGSEEQASIDTILTTVTDGSEVSDIIFSVQQSGAITELARFDGSGDQLDLSGSLNLGDTDSSITGTTAVINFTNFDVSSTGEITLAAGAGLDTNGAGVLDLGVTNATSIVAGSGSLTSFTITTDGTGDTEVELPDGSINTDEILDATILTGDIAADTILELNLDAVDTPSDEECLTYESGAGGDFEWQACAGGSTSLDDAYNNGQSITVDTADILLDLNDSTNDYGLVIDNNTASTIDTGLEFTSAGGGALTTAIDASAALIGNALSIGANTILGTTGVIDFTDFDVSNDGAVTIANDGNVVSLTIDSAATTGDVVQINDAQITGGNVLEIQNADALTTGSIASFMSDGTDTSTRSLVEIINENTAATGATGLTVRQDADERAVFIDQNGDSVGLSIDTEATTSAALRIASPTHTTGNVIEVTSANSLTNGSILDLTSNSSSTTTRNLAVIHNDNTAATGATVLSLRQDADQRALFINQDANGSGIEIDSEATSAAAIAVDSAATTTGNIIQVDTANSLTTGSIAYFRSNGSDTSTRHLVNIINDNTAATGAVGLRIQQDSTGDILELYDGSNEVFTVDDQGALIIAPATATTTAIDVSDSDITNALSVGANTITGTSAVIDFNNFDVAASGAITISPSSALTTGIDLTDTDITNAISIGQNTILGTTAAIDFAQFDVATSGNLTTIGTIGLQIDSNANNIFNTSAGTATTDDLYWGDDLLCDVSESNCGTGGGSSLFTDGGAITYLTSETDDFALGGTTAAAPFYFDEGEEQLNLNNTTTNAALLLNQDGNGIALQIDAESTSANVIDIATTAPVTTTGNIIDIQADALTTGSLLDLQSDSSDTGTRSLVNIVNDNTAATGATALRVQQDAAQVGVLIDQNGADFALHIDSESTGAAIRIEAPATTTGRVIDVDSANNLTSGAVARFHSNGSNTTTRHLVNIINDNTAATGAVGLRIQQDSTGDILELYDGGSEVVTVDDEGQITIAGTGDGTDALTLTTGDILVSDGDVDIAAGDFNVTLDALDTANITNSSASRDILHITGATSADNIDAFVITHTVTDSDGSAAANITLTNADDATAADTIYGILLTLDDNSTAADDTVYGLYIDNPDSGGSDADLATDAFIYLDNSDDTVTVADGIIVASAGGAVTDALDASDSAIVNALNVGANTITGTSGVIDFTAFDVAGTGAVTIAPTSSLTTAIDLTDTDITNAISIGQNTILGTTAAIDFAQFDVATSGNLTTIGTIGLQIDSNANNIFNTSAGTATTDDLYWGDDLLCDVSESNCGTGGGSSLFTDGGAITYLTSQTDDLALGGTTAAAPFYFDEGEEQLNLNNTTTNAALLLNQDGNGIALDIDAESTSTAVINIATPATTTGDVIDIDADALTTGSILNLDSDSSDSSTRNLVRINNDNTAATGTTALSVRQDAAQYSVNVDQNGDAAAINIDTEATSAGAIRILSATQTTGNIIAITQADSLTSGGIARLQSNSSSTTTRELLEIVNDNTAATGATPLSIQQDADRRAVFLDQNGNGAAITIDTEATSANGVNIPSAATTTGDVLSIRDANSLTTGHIAEFHSDSSSASTRNLVLIHNDHTSATGATPLAVQQDAAQQAVFVDQNGNGIALQIDSESTSTNVLYVASPATTTGNVFRTDADALTTGRAAYFSSNSSDTSTRHLVDIVNDNTAATGAVGLRIQQDSTGDILELYDGASEVFTVDDQGALIIAPATATTTAIDVSDSDITNALSVGANTITGTSAVIDFNNFDVAASGAITISPSSALTTGIDLTDTDLTNALSIGDNTILGTAAVIDFTDFDLSADGLIVLTPDDGGDAFTLTPSAAITDALDVSNALITNALNIGANTIVGTTGVIDFTNFDVSTVGSITAQESTATHIFGDAASLEIPNSTGPTVNAAGEIAVDTTNDQIKYYGGAERVLTYQKKFGATIESPAANVDNFNLLKAPYALTITDIECIVDPADSSESVVIDIEERDSTGDSPATVDATITCDNDGASDDGSLSNGTIDSGDWVSIDIGAVTGTVTQVTVTITYTVDGT